LLDAKGKIVQTATTGDGGAYTFTGLNALQTYYVNPVSGRTQASTPASTTAPAMLAATATSLRGKTAPIKVTAAPRTFVLITPIDYSVSQSPSYTNPPKVGQLLNSQFAFSGIADSSGQVTIPVPAGTYWITCWAGNQRTNNTSGKINLGLPITPQVAPYLANCP
jgi:hypothetical protein